MTIDIAGRRKLLPAVAFLAAGLTACGGEDPSADRLSELARVPDIATCSRPVRDVGDGDARPVIFVHGGFGSANQFQSQAMRFVQNGHPPGRLVALEYDALTQLDATIDEFDGRRHFDLIAEVLDACINEMQLATGSATVNVIGHSRGTSVMTRYLTDPRRAADVEHYVNIDGSADEDAPAGVETLAIWDQRNRGDMAGAENVDFDMGHVEVATSAEAFGEFYEFLKGEPPESTAVTAEPDGSTITLRGRAQEFPANEGVEQGRVEIFELDDMGMRTSDTPEAVLELGSRGRWGPFQAEAGTRYELVLKRDDGGMTHHHFREPFIVDNAFVRLLTVPPDGGLLDALIAQNDNHTNITILRDKEFWGDQSGSRNDILQIDGTNVTTADLAKRIDEGSVSDGVGEGTVALFAFDENEDSTTDLSAPVEPISGVPFLLGVDLFVDASTMDPPESSEVKLIGRGTGGVERVVHVQRWPSETRLTTVRFRDFVAEQPDAE